MANQERGRSPSAGQGGRVHNAAAASASPNPRASVSTSLDPSSFALDDPALNSLRYNGLGLQSHLGVDYSSSFGQADYNTLLAQQAQLASQELVNDHPFLQSQALGGAGNGAGLGYLQGGQDQLMHQGNINYTSDAFANPDSNAFPSFDLGTTDFISNTALDPSLLKAQDTSLGNMATSMQPPSPTPPHLLPEMARRHSNSPSPQTLPGFQQHQSYMGARPRNTSESLDPSSAMYPPSGANEWASMGPYRTHKRTPSDQYSDYSSHSNQASPYLQTYDTFDAQTSPLLNPQQDPTFDALGLQQFTLGDTQQHQQSYHTPGHSPQQTYHTPGHSPRISPQLMPQQHGLPQFATDNGFAFGTNQFAHQSNGYEMFPPLSKPQSPSEFGQADQMSPPEIQVEFAPPSTTNVNPHMKLENDQEALSPPARTQSHARRRAVSDSFANSRPTSPSLISRARSPSLQPNLNQTDSKLSPFNSAVTSRSPSPSPNRGRDRSANRARSTSHTSDQRDYILTLAEPERAPSANSTSGGGRDNNRVQKHPATFQCTLCPKRFTRAYNLRSHLRTHTDERPFVCTVCKKAFARQHDRKRHEGLHSGEKKFVCRGVLQSSAQWGCGRRFARADALGRHFRSEAGRVCIRPLLEEEAAERRKAWMEEQRAVQASEMAELGVSGQQQQMMSQPMQPQMDLGGNFLPAVLLQQYPALAGIDWNSLPQGPPPDELDLEDYAGRSSFEASSGGEFYDEMSENEMGMDMGMDGYVDPGLAGMGQGQVQAQAGAGQLLPHQQQHQGYMYPGVGVQGAGDYLGDFEGR